MTKKMIKISIGSFFLFLLFFALIPNFIYADSGLVPCTNECIRYDIKTGKCIEWDFCTLCDLFSMFGRVINFLLFYIIPPLAALMIAIGGFMYVLAYTGLGGGGPNMLSQANSLFKAVIIGLVIVYGAWLLVEAFFAAIGVKPIFRDWNAVLGCGV